MSRTYHRSGDYSENKKSSRRNAQKRVRQHNGPIQEGGHYKRIGQDCYSSNGFSTVDKVHRVKDFHRSKMPVRCRPHYKRNKLPADFSEWDSYATTNSWEIREDIIFNSRHYYVEKAKGSFQVRACQGSWRAPHDTVILEHVPGYEWMFEREWTERILSLEIDGLIGKRGRMHLWGIYDISEVATDRLQKILRESKVEKDVFLSLGLRYYKDDVWYDENEKFERGRSCYGLEKRDIDRRRRPKKRKFHFEFEEWRGAPVRRKRKQRKRVSTYHGWQRLDGTVKPWIECQVDTVMRCRGLNRREAISHVLEMERRREEMMELYRP